MTRKLHTEEQITAVRKDAQVGIRLHELGRKQSVEEGGVDYYRDDALC